MWFVPICCSLWQEPELLQELMRPEESLDVARSAPPKVSEDPKASIHIFLSTPPATPTNVMERYKRMIQTVDKRHADWF